MEILHSGIQLCYRALWHRLRRKYRLPVSRLNQANVECMRSLSLFTDGFYPVQENSYEDLKVHNSTWKWNEAVTSSTKKKLSQLCKLWLERLHQNLWFMHQINSFHTFVYHAGAKFCLALWWNGQTKALWFCYSWVYWWVSWWCGYSYWIQF